MRAYDGNQHCRDWVAGIPLIVGNRSLCKVVAYGAVQCDLETPLTSWVTLQIFLMLLVEALHNDTSAVLRLAACQVRNPPIGHG